MAEAATSKINMLEKSCVFPKIKTSFQPVKYLHQSVMENSLTFQVVVHVEKRTGGRVYGKPTIFLVSLLCFLQVTYKNLNVRSVF